MPTKCCRPSDRPCLDSRGQVRVFRVRVWVLGLTQSQVPGTERGSITDQNLELIEQTHSLDADKVRLA